MTSQPIGRAFGSSRIQSDPRFSLVIPTYNPGHVLAQTWSQLCSFLKDAGPTWEILLVCDGCSDGTTSLLEEWNHREQLPIRILSYAVNRGKGHAVRYGMAAAHGQACIFTDVDLAYRFEDIKRLAQALEEGADVAIASRFHPQSRLIIPPHLQGYAYRRYLQSLVFSWVARRLLPISQRDTQAGLKALSARAIRLLLPHLRCDGFGFDCELLTACARLGIDVTEVPVMVRMEDAHSTTSFQTMGKMIGELVKIRREWKSTPSVEPVAKPMAREAA